MSSGSWWWWGSEIGEEGSNILAYIYTDRPIYQPGQIVYFKAILRADRDVKYSLPPVGTPLLARLIDPRDNVGETVELTSNTYGTGARLKELGLEKGRIGIVGPLPSWWTITLPHEHHVHLTTTFPSATFETVTDWFEDFRVMKSDEELARMERAGALCDVAHEEVVLASRPGVRHSDLRAIMDGVANRFGGRYPFSHVGSTSMANLDRCYPDFFPTHQTLEAGHVVMTEVALGYGLYFGKIWGTYFIGEPTPSPSRCCWRCWCRAWAG